MTTPETRASAALARAHSTSIQEYEAVADAIREAKTPEKRYGRTIEDIVEGSR